MLENNQSRNMPGDFLPSSGFAGISGSLGKLPAGWREQVELLRVDCLKTCRQGPNVRINQELFPGITPEVLIGLLKDKLRLLEA